MFYKDLMQLSELPHKFCVPAHKGHRSGIDLYKIDLTEIEGADNAAAPSGALRQSEQLCSRLFESGDTLYCTSGSSTALKAAIGYACGQGGTLAAVVPAHRCLADAAAIFNLSLVFISSYRNRVTSEKLRGFLLQSRPNAIFLCYADYDGNILNLSELLPICRELGVKVVVDNAHGGYIRFLPRSLGLYHPVLMGADFVVDSASKTLGAVTPAALLHTKNPNDTPDLRRFINILSTTSPPYGVMYSLDYSMRALAIGDIDYTAAVEKSIAIKKKYSSFLMRNDEPLKIVFAPPANSLCHNEVAKKLKLAGVVPELCNPMRVLFMISPFNTDDDLDALDRVLRDIFSDAVPTPWQQPQIPLPRMALSSSSAFKGSYKNVSLEQAVGRISAHTVAPCPPGTVVLYSGQVVAEAHIEILKQAGIEQIAVIQA